MAGSKNILPSYPLNLFYKFSQNKLTLFPLKNIYHLRVNETVMPERFRRKSNLWGSGFAAALT
jgi:hypothetical protein